MSPMGKGWANPPRTARPRHEIGIITDDRHDLASDLSLELVRPLPANTLKVVAGGRTKTTISGIPSFIQPKVLTPSPATF